MVEASEARTTTERWWVTEIQRVKRAQCVQKISEKLLSIRGDRRCDSHFRPVIHGRPSKCPGPSPPMSSSPTPSAAPPEPTPSAAPPSEPMQVTVVRMMMFAPPSNPEGRSEGRVAEDGVFNRFMERLMEVETEIRLDRLETDIRHRRSSLGQLMETVESILLTQPPQRGLSPEQLRGYPPTAVTDDMLSSTCCICLEEFEMDQKVRVMPCQHKFHQRCIDTWLAKEARCPLCKGEVVAKEEGATAQPPQADGTDESTTATSAHGGGAHEQAGGLRRPNPNW